MAKHFELIVTYTVDKHGATKVEHIGEKVTRCKDCKYRYKFTGSEKHRCDFRGGVVTDNGFCEYGEPERPTDYYWLVDDDGCACSNCESYFYNDGDHGEDVKEYSHCPDCGVFIIGTKEVISAK